jgi:hypothetical protein
MKILSLVEEFTSKQALSQYIIAGCGLEKVRSPFFIIDRALSGQIKQNCLVNLYRENAHEEYYTCNVSVCFAMDSISTFWG